MITCEHASRLISDRLQRGLGLSDKLTLGLHLIICARCRGFARQMRFLRHFVVAGRDGPEGLEPSLMLDARARRRIIVSLQERRL